MKGSQVHSRIVTAAPFYCFVLVFAASCGGDAIVSIPPPPTPPTLSEQLGEVLDDTLQAYVGTGVSAAVLMPNAERWAGASGISHGNVPITTQMLFGASSVTKIYVAALTLKLAEAGMLSLDDSLHQWLDGYAHVDSNITIRQLLNHTSGVFDFVAYPGAWDSIIYDPSRVWTPEEIITSFIDEPYSPPGTELHYSNTGYLLVGMVITAAADTTVSSELRSRLWEPLGLSSTFFEVEETVSGTLAHAWINTGGDSLIDFSAVPRTATYSASWTAGAVFTTARELAEWGQALYGGEILTEASLSELLVDPGNGVGLGTDLELGPVLADGEPVVGLIGSGVGYSAVLAYLPDYGTSVAVMMNDNNLGYLIAIASALIATALEHQA